MQVESFERVDLGLSLRKFIAELGSHPARPSESGFIRRSIAKFEFSLGHHQGCGILPSDASYHFRYPLGDLLRVGVVADVPRWGSVVHPHLVPAGPLRHNSNEGVVRAEHRRHVSSESTIVVRRD